MSARRFLDELGGDPAGDGGDGDEDGGATDEAASEPTDGGSGQAADSVTQGEAARLMADPTGPSPEPEPSPRQGRRAAPAPEPEPSPPPAPSPQRGRTAAPEPEPTPSLPTPSQDATPRPRPSAPEPEPTPAPTPEPEPRRTTTVITEDRTLEEREVEPGAATAAVTVELPSGELIGASGPARSQAAETFTQRTGLEVTEADVVDIEPGPGITFGISESAQERLQREQAAQQLEESVQLGARELTGQQGGMATPAFERVGLGMGVDVDISPEDLIPTGAGGFALGGAALGEVREAAADRPRAPTEPQAAVTQPVDVSGIVADPANTPFSGVSEGAFSTRVFEEGEVVGGERRQGNIQRELPEGARDEFEDPMFGFSLRPAAPPGRTGEPAGFVPFSAFPGVQGGTTLEDLLGEGEESVLGFGEQFADVLVQGAIPNPAFQSSLQGPSAVEAATEAPEPQSPFIRQTEAAIEGGVGLFATPFSAALAVEEAREFGIEFESRRQEEGLGLTFLPDRQRDEAAIPRTGFETAGRAGAGERTEVTADPLLQAEGALGFAEAEAGETGEAIVSGLERQVESPTGRAALAGSLVASAGVFAGAAAISPRTGLATRAAIQPGEEALGFGGFAATRRLFGRGAAERFFPNQEPLIFSEEAAIRRGRQAARTLRRQPSDIADVLRFEPSPRQAAAFEALRPGGTTGQLVDIEGVEGEAVAELEAEETIGLPGASEPLGSPTEGILEATTNLPGAEGLTGEVGARPAGEPTLPRVEPGGPGEAPPPLFGEIQEAGDVRRFIRGEEPARGPRIFPEDVEIAIDTSRVGAGLGAFPRVEVRTEAAEPEFQQFEDFSQFGQITPDFIEQRQALFGGFEAETDPIGGARTRARQAERAAVEPAGVEPIGRFNIEGLFGAEAAATVPGSQQRNIFGLDQEVLLQTLPQVGQVETTVPRLDQELNLGPDIETAQEVRQEQRLDFPQEIEFRNPFDPRGEFEQEAEFEFETEFEFESEFEAEVEPFRFDQEPRDEDEEFFSPFGPVGATFENPFQTAGQALQLGFAGFGGGGAGLFGETADAPDGSGGAAGDEDAIPNPFF